MAVDCEKTLDDVGWQILAALQDNGRLSFAELGRRVHLSLPAVAERVKRMEETGVITGYHAAVSMDRLGLSIGAFIRISTSQEGCARVTALAAERPEIRECHRVTGTDSYIMKVTVSSIAHLEALIDRLMSLGPLSTSIVLSSPVVKRVMDRVSLDVGPS
jgi:Lrp/AsnC family leucine-responsive transcriptional regulator